MLSWVHVLFWFSYEISEKRKSNVSCFDVVLKMHPYREQSLRVLSLEYGQKNEFNKIWVASKGMGTWYVVILHLS